MAIKRQAWQEDPFVGGAYAFYRPGQWFADQPLQHPTRTFFSPANI
jgi:hypothetical protein